MLHPPHAIVMTLHGRDIYAVIPIPETADLMGTREVAGVVGRVKPRMARHHHRELTTTSTVFYSHGGKFNKEQRN